MEGAESICQTCSHRKRAHLDGIGACCMQPDDVQVYGDWCSCVQYVPTPQQALEEAWDNLRAAYRESLRRQFDNHPELHGKIFRPKPAGPGMVWRTAMVFSLNLLDAAGGVWQLLREWEVDDG